MPLKQTHVHNHDMLTTVYINFLGFVGLSMFTIRIHRLLSHNSVNLSSSNSSKLLFPAECTRFFSVPQKQSPLRFHSYTDDDLNQQKLATIYEAEKAICKYIRIICILYSIHLWSCWTQPKNIMAQLIRERNIRQVYLIIIFALGGNLF